MVAISRSNMVAINSNMILRKGVGPGKVVPNIRFLGIFDTVASFGLPGNRINLRYNLSIPHIVQYTAHAIALNERRIFFPLSSILKEKNNPGKYPNLVEKGFKGDHSNIGGGHQNSDVSDYALQWMRTQGIKEGVPFKTLPSQYRVVTRPNYYDSKGSSLVTDKRVVFYPNSH